jgi:hypothetical protein
MGKETFQVEEILEFSKWKYCCGKFYVSLILPNLTKLSQLQRLCKLGSKHKLQLCKNFESNCTGLQLFGLLLRYSTEQTEESRERGVIHV